MSESARQIALWLIPAAPLAASVLIALTGVRWLRQRSHWPCILAVAVSLAASLDIMSKFRLSRILLPGKGRFATKCLEPSRPSSSAAHNAMMIVFSGLTPVSMTAFAIVMMPTVPDPLSSAPFQTYPFHMPMWS